MGKYSASINENQWETKITELGDSINCKLVKKRLETNTFFDLDDLTWSLW